MDEGHIKLHRPYKQTESKMQVTEDFEQLLRLSLCDCGNAQTRNGPHRSHPLPIRQMELSGVHQY